MASHQLPSLRSGDNGNDAGCRPTLRSLQAPPGSERLIDVVRHFLTRDIATIRLIVALAAGVGVLPTACVQTQESRTLWRIVHDACVPDQRRYGRPAPCSYVTADYAVLKDLRGRTHFLLIPTRKSRGIEDSTIRAPDAPNYWQAAWHARTYIFASAGERLPRNAVGMAINSRWARSQTQLHIHIDCVRRDVRDELSAHLAEIHDSWSTLPVTLDGRSYTARRLDSPDLQGENPFRLLAQSIQPGQPGMENRTLVVIGATFAADSGFILLSDEADMPHGDFAHGEDLLDHACAIAAHPSR